MLVTDDRLVAGRDLLALARGAERGGATAIQLRLKQASARALVAAARTLVAAVGVPVLVNTSFNVRGEPIVCTPAEAFNSFSHTDMDYLMMGSALIPASSKQKIRAYPGATNIWAGEEVVV